MGGGGDGGTAFSYRANHLKFNRSQNLEHLEFPLLEIPSHDKYLFSLLCQATEQGWGPGLLL